MSQEVLLYAILAFGPLAFGAVEPWSLSILETAIFCLFARCRRHYASSPLTTADKTLLAAILGMIALGLFQRINPHPVTGPSGLFPFTTSAYATSQAIILWCAYAALVWCVPRILQDGDAYRRFPWSILILGAVIAVIGISQLGQGNQAYYGFRSIRQGAVFGPYTNHNHAASMMALAFTMGLGLFASRVVQFRRIQGVGRSADLLAGQVLILFLLGIIMTGIIKVGSRGGIHSLILGSLSACVLAFGFLPKKRALPLIIIGLIAILAAYGMLLYVNPDLLTGGFKALGNSAKWRISMYTSGLQMLHDFPVWGVGLGAFADAFLPYQERMITGFVTHIHSDWLELWIETGMAGLGVGCAAMTAFLWMSLRQWRAMKSRTQKTLLLGAFGAAACFMIHGLVEFNFQIPANAVAFLSILAFLMTTIPDDHPSIHVPSKIEHALSMSTIVCLIFFALRPAIASWSVYVSEKAPPSARVHYLTRASHWDGNPTHELAICRRYMDLANGNPMARGVLFRQSLISCMRVLSINPLSPQARGLAAVSLWNLNRPQDSLALR